MSMWQYVTNVYDGVATLWTRPRDELIRFFVNRNINPYLKNSVQREDFVARFQVGRTTIRFERLDLDDRILNAKLGPDQPFRVRSASLFGVAVQIPWSDLAAECVLLQVERVAVTLAPYDPVIDVVAVDADADEQLMSRSVSRSTLGQSNMAQSTLGTSSMENAFVNDPWMAGGAAASSGLPNDAAQLGAAFADSGDSSRETKADLEHLFANIFANLQVQLDALDVRIDYDAASALTLALRGVVYKSRDDSAIGTDVVRKVLIFESLSSSIGSLASPLSLFSLAATSADLIAVDFSRKALEEVTGVEEQPQSLSIVANIDGTIRLALAAPVVSELTRCATTYARAASLCSQPEEPSDALSGSNNAAVIESMSQSILLRLSPYSRWRPRTATLLSEATLIKVRLRHIEGVLGSETLHFRRIVAKHVFVERASELGCGLVELTDGAEAIMRCGDTAVSDSNDDDEGGATPPIWLRVTAAAAQRSLASEHNLVVVVAPVHILVAPQRLQSMMDLVAPLLQLPRVGNSKPVDAMSKRVVRVSWPAPLQLVCRVPEAQLECAMTLRNASCAVIVAPQSTRASVSFDSFELVAQRASARKTKAKRTSSATRRVNGAPLLRFGVSGSRASVFEVRLRATPADAASQQPLTLPAHRDDALWSMGQLMLVQQEPSAARLGFDARQHIGSAFALKNADACVQAALCDVALAVDSVADVTQCVDVLHRMLPAPASTTTTASTASSAVQVRIDSVVVDLESQFALRLQNVDCCAGTRYARLPVSFLFCGTSHLSLMRNNTHVMLCGTPTGLVEQLPPVLPELVVNVEGASVRTVVGSLQTTFIVTRLSLVPHAPNWMALLDIAKSAAMPSTPASPGPASSSPSSEFGVAIRHINLLHLSGPRRCGSLCVAVDNVSGRVNPSSSAHVSVQSVSVHLLAPSSATECPRRWIPSSSTSNENGSFMGATVGLFRSREAVGHSVLDVSVALGSSPLVVAIDAQSNVLRMRFTKAQFAALNDLLATLGAAAGPYFDIPLPQLPDESAEAERLQRKAVLEETLRAAFAHERQQQQQQQQQQSASDTSAPIDMRGSIVLNANEIADELDDMRGSMLLVESGGDGSSGGGEVSEARVQSEVDAVMRSTEWIVMQDDNNSGGRKPLEASDYAEPIGTGRSWSLPLDEAFAHTPLAFSLQLSRFGVSIVLAGEPNAAAAAAASSKAASTFDALEVRLNAPLIRFEQFQLAESVRPADGDLSKAVKQHPAHFYDQFTPNMRVSVRFDLFDVRDHVLTSSYKRAFRICESADNATVGELRIEFVAHQRWAPSQRKLSLIAQIPPMRAYVNQDSWDFLWLFLARDGADGNAAAAPASSTPPPPSPLPTLLELLDVTPISIVVDYKPGMRAGSFSALMATGDYMYMLKMVPLEQSSVELRRLRLRNVLAENWTTLAMQRYFPNYDRSHLARLLVGVQPVHVAFKLGAGAADLVRVPLAEYRRGGSVVAGLQAGVKTLTVEVLTLGSRVSSVAARLLGGGSDTAALRGADGSATDEALQRISRYANQPATVNEGVQQAVEQLRDGVLSGLRAVAVDPVNAYQRDGAWAFLSSAVSGVPRLVLRPAMGLSSAIAKVTQGVRNQLEPERKREADQKWKAANDDAQLDDFEM